MKTKIGALLLAMGIMIGSTSCFFHAHVGGGVGYEPNHLNKDSSLVTTSTAPVHQLIPTQIVSDASRK